MSEKMDTLIEGSVSQYGELLKDYQQLMAEIAALANELQAVMGSYYDTSADVIIKKMRQLSAV